MINKIIFQKFIEGTEKMENQSIAKNDLNIDLSIHLINDISTYAKTVTHITLKTGCEIKGYVFDDEEPVHDKNENEYLDEIANLVEKFGQMVDHAITVENGAIKRKEDLLKVKLLRRVLSDWQPLEVITKKWITALYDWFQYRIDQESKSYLNRIIACIQFKEVENE